MELSKQYDPKQVEDKIYQKWLEGRYFHAEVNAAKTPYTIVIPPPNITGQLHLGHALNNMLQDCLIRTRRMQGFEALWLPGTDHASIATEARIVETMAAEGLTKETIGREAFLDRAWDWKRRYGGRIIEQLKKLGSSCDWERERFTMDEGCNRAVVEVFVNLYEKGLIYRGERIINWCPHCRTAISDAEVDFAEKEGNFWHIRYPLSDSSGFIEVATTRPETMLGDTAVAVNPDDPRYATLVGKTLILPLMDREIPVVADSYVESEFGTGAVKITPAHDPNDFEVGRRHQLPVINVMDDSAVINENGGRYAGMTREAARKAVVADLEAGGYLTRIEPHVHNVGTCSRCSATVEPRLSKQWFVKMDPLAAPAIKSVECGEITLIPERFEKIYYNWMYNIRDWCISRQLWWGHRIPAWYCAECGEMTVAKEPPAACRCGGALTQDSDTLDTWFSSALWPFSTLGWPEQTADLAYFYPTNVIVTAYDIIFFWIARMIFSGLEHMGQKPFDTVVFTGLIRDAQGRKMSKSLGNGVDPLEVIDEYGADALRLALAIGVSPGNDMRFSIEKVKAFRNFANKIWNAARFILMNDVSDVVPDSLPETLNMEDKWLLGGLNTLIKDVTDHIDKFELGLAAGKIYDFIWDVFCDWYIELIKPRLGGGDKASTASAKHVMVYAFTQLLRLLHPFMPFITEELYGALPHTGESIMISEYPVYTEALCFARDETDFTKIMEVIKAIRVMRGEKNVPPGRKTTVYLETVLAETFEKGRAFIERLASAEAVHIGPAFTLEDAVRLATADARILIPMRELIDLEQEKERLSKELAAARREIEQLEGRLANEQFVSRAPAAVVEQERERLTKARAKAQNLEQSLRQMQ